MPTFISGWRSFHFIVDDDDDELHGVVQYCCKSITLSHDRFGPALKCLEPSHEPIKCSSPRADDATPYYSRSSVGTTAPPLTCDVVSPTALIASASPRSTCPFLTRRTQSPKKRRRCRLLTRSLAHIATFRKYEPFHRRPILQGDQEQFTAKRYASFHPPHSFTAWSAPTDHWAKSAHSACYF